MRRPHKGLDTFQHFCGEFLKVVSHETSLKNFRLEPHAGERGRKGMRDNKVDRYNV